MKKLICIYLVLVMVLTGCGQARRLTGGSDITIKNPDENKSGNSGDNSDNVITLPTPSPSPAPPASGDNMTDTAEEETGNKKTSSITVFGVIAAAAVTAGAAIYKYVKEAPRRAINKIIAPAKEKLKKYQNDFKNNYKKGFDKHLKFFKCFLTIPFIQPQVAANCNEVAVNVLRDIQQGTDQQILDFIAQQPQLDPDQVQERERVRNLLVQEPQVLQPLFDTQAQQDQELLDFLAPTIQHFPRVQFQAVENFLEQRNQVRQTFFDRQDQELMEALVQSPLIDFYFAVHARHALDRQNFQFIQAQEVINFLTLQFHDIMQAANNGLPPNEIETAHQYVVNQGRNMLDTFANGQERTDRQALDFILNPNYFQDLNRIFATQEAERRQYLTSHLQPNAQPNPHQPLLPFNERVYQAMLTRHHNALQAQLNRQITDIQNFLGNHIYHTQPLPNQQQFYGLIEFFDRQAQAQLAVNRQVFSRLINLVN